MARTAVVMATVMLIVFSATGGAAEPSSAGKPLRIIAFGAHPDDCELKVGGTAAKWAALGHQVKFVSVTNGDIGHYAMAGGPLAQRRTAEVQDAAKVLGVTTQVLDHHDGELEPTLEIRKELIRLVREWKADVVIAPRPNDYHPDHRYTSILVQDGAYMVAVPYICPDTPPLEKNPVYLYTEDSFQKPYPFEADIMVDVGDTADKKFEALSKIQSQFLEWLPWMAKMQQMVPKEPEKAKQFMLEMFKARMKRSPEKDNAALVKRYGQEQAGKIEYVESFEICEYGSQPDEDEIRALFPFFPKG
ncbi:MAG: PIG-L family deacetylase [Chloroflexi bacterium]|nr:PIG-L family deacetylase [Chloroflexota bacterium]